jgi:hypothetical protein
MEFSERTNRYMESSKTWGEILDFIKDVTPWLTTGAILWKGIDKVFAYWSAARAEQLKEIVHEEMKPEINNLSKKIELLSDAIWALKNQK